MPYSVELDHSETLNILKKEFESSLTKEVIPGMLHNFANPLNGILGRAKLLQRRLNDNLIVVHDHTASTDIDNFKKIFNDVELLSNGVDNLFDLFNDMAGKFYRLTDVTCQRMNLSELIETEMAFFNFYLDFKHHVRKTLVLDKEIKEVTGAPADYTMIFWVLIRHSMHSMQDSDKKDLTISTSSDSGYVYVDICDTGIHAEHELHNQDTKMDYYNKILHHAFSLVKKYDAICQIERANGSCITTLKIPY